MNDIYFILLVFFISLIVAWLTFRPILHFAKHNNLYDNPESRKLQRRPIPLLGGVVVFVGAIVGALSYWFKNDCTSIIPIEVAMFIMLLIGTWDDIKHLSPYLRFAIEIIVVVTLALINNSPINDFHGLWGVDKISPWIAWPLTVVACVGIINAINMIDGIDGLSSGICIMSCGFFGLFFFYKGDFVHTALAISLIGGLIPFFIVNVFGNRSKMFIGDGGTMMLGIAMCEFVMTMLTHDSICTRKTPSNFCIVAFALAVLAIPVFDTIRVMLGRICRGDSPFYPDKTHLHHAFIDYGFHHLETSLMEIILNMGIIGVWWVTYKSHLSTQWQLYAVIIAGVGVTFGLYYMLGRRKRIATKVKEKYGIEMEQYELLNEEELKALIQEKNNNESKENI